MVDLINPTFIYYNNFFDIGTIMFLIYSLVLPFMYFFFRFYFFAFFLDFIPPNFKGYFIEACGILVLFILLFSALY